MNDSLVGVYKLGNNKQKCRVKGKYIKNRE